MPLVLTITPIPGPTGARAADRQIRTLAQGSLSIGRSAGNDWVLADPDQHLSRTHCMISYDAGRCTLTDLSTNGMFVNGAREPTTRNSRIVLTDGDSVRLGGYMLEIAEADAPAVAASPGGFALDPFSARRGDNPLDADPFDAPLGDELGGFGAGAAFQHPLRQPPPSVRTEDPFDAAPQAANRDDDELFRPRRDEFKGPAQPDHADARAQAYAAPRVIAPANLADIDFDDLIGDLTPGGVKPTAAPPPASPSASPSAAPSAAPPASPSPAARPAAADPFDDLLDEPPPPVPPIVAPAPPPQAMPAAPAQAAPAATAAPIPAPPAADAQALLAAFLDGAGVPGLAVSAADPQATMRAYGALFAAFAAGTREVLMSRAEVKQEMRVERTMLRARDNNALKFSVTPAEAVAALLQPGRPGYKPPLAAVEEAFKDIRSHEMAVMAGMQTALLSLLARFDPASLEGRLQRGMLDSILPGARKARFWELFCATYKDIAREAADDFHAAFGREFAQAYDRQVAKL